MYLWLPSLFNVAISISIDLCLFSPAAAYKEFLIRVEPSEIEEWDIDEYTKVVARALGDKARNMGGRRNTGKGRR